MNEIKIFKNSILVVAHPDDEALWFSSIIEKVRTILICFRGYQPQPRLTIGRRKSLSEHPIKDIRCLAVEEAGSFNKADWVNPVPSPSGLLLTDNIIRARYEENFFRLKEQLKKYVADYSHVFTHNPWGEYGHEDHVQVYRVLDKLREEAHFNLWFPNYCSNKSIYLAMLYQHRGIFDSGSIRLKTNKIMARQIKALYQKHDCWTWFPDWEWFNEESFSFTGDINSNTAITHKNHAAAVPGLSPFNFIQYNFWGGVPWVA